MHDQQVYVYPIFTEIGLKISIENRCLSAPRELSGA